MLQMQGIGWFMRRLISLATVTLTITQYTSSDDNSTHIDIHQIASPGNISSDENRILDWTYRDHSDKVFGEVKGKSRWAKLKEVDDHEFLKEGYDDLEGEHVQGYVESKSGGWTVDQTWGFETIDGKRYHTRRIICRKGDDWKLARLVLWQNCDKVSDNLGIGTSTIVDP
ncbi:hypothetical protein Q9189_006347 [Teloschistes chrysophthalmus]